MKNNMNKDLKTNIIVFILFFFISNLTLKAQLINVESERMQTDSLKFTGHLAASFSYQQNNNELLSQFNGSVAIQTKTKSLKDVFLLLGGYETIESNSNMLSNAKFAHFRYTRKFKKHFRWEAFVQTQNNLTLLLKKRIILGTGPRFRVIHNKKIMLSLGSLYMYENEETLESRPQIHNNQRISSYLSFNYIGFGEFCELNSITYFQPRIDLFNDYRFSTQTSLNIAFSKSISLIFGLRFMYEAFPPEGVNKNSFSTEMGLKAIL